MVCPHGQGVVKPVRTFFGQEGNGEFFAILFIYYVVKYFMSWISLMLLGRFKIRFVIPEITSKLQLCKIELRKK